MSEYSLHVLVFFCAVDRWLENTGVSSGRRRIYVRRMNRRQFPVIVKRMNCGRMSRKRITISCGKRKIECSERSGCFSKISHVELWEMFTFGGSNDKTVRTWLSSRKSLDSRSLHFEKAMSNLVAWVFCQEKEDLCLRCKYLNAKEIMLRRK